MRIRSSLVEHPFGIIKQRAGMKHFLMRGLEKCRGEFSLMVLGFNFTRVLKIIGLQALQDYCVQRSCSIPSASMTMPAGASKAACVIEMGVSLIRLEP